MQTIREHFKKHYPKRNGKLIWTGFERALARVEEEDYNMLCKSVIHYAKSELVQKGFGIKDPCRFIWDGMNREFYWLNWIEPELSKDDMVKREADRERNKRELKTTYQDKTLVQGFLDTCDPDDARYQLLVNRMKGIDRKIGAIEDMVNNDLQTKSILALK